MNPDFSVLMAVYRKDNPAWFRAALDSLVGQTLLPQEIVLVQDGPLTAELEAVIGEFSRQHPKLLTHVVLPENRGLGPALNVGLEHCRHEIVARMDSDDLSKPDRFARQIPELALDAGLAVLGGWLEEFSDRPDQPDQLKTVPEGGQALVRYAKNRNPVNHPTAAFRKSIIQACGGYENVPYFEDYHLWAKVLQAGHRIRNLQAVLLSFRTDSQFLSRRSGRQYRAHERYFLSLLEKIGFLSRAELLKALIMRSILRMLPKALLKKLYKTILRKKENLDG